MDRYPIDTLDIESEPVWFTLGEGEVEGCLKVTARNRYVYRVFVDGHRRPKTKDLPKHAVPYLWRPIYPDRWPEPLPEAASILSPTYDPEKKPAPDPEPQDEIIPDHDWPLPGIVCGPPGQAPKSRAEAEARIRRALRTAKEWERADRPRSQILWPQPWLIEAKIIEKRLRASPSGDLVGLTREDLTDFYIDRTDLRALPTIWLPTRRDIGDIEQGVLNWLRALSREERTLLTFRSVNPEWTWRMIGDWYRTNRRTVLSRYKLVSRYERAIDKIWNASR